MPDDRTVKLIITLHPFADMEQAARVADEIKNSGTVTYNDVSGSTVTLNVGDVTVEG